MTTATTTKTTQNSATVTQRVRCEVWTRVMGYHRPVSQFNRGKKSEHYNRKHFTECAMANHAFNQHYAD